MDSVSLPLRRPVRIVTGTAAAEPEDLAADRELLRAVLQGDERVARILYQRVRPIIQSTVARLLGARDVDAEDTMQLALYELVRTASSFRGDCPLEAWVRVLTARIVFKHVRRRKLERRIFTAEAACEPAAPAGVTYIAMHRSALRRIKEHLAALDADRAWTFLLHDVYGYDLKEAAEITGVSVSAAQTRLSRGRRELKSRIETDPELSEQLTNARGSK